MRRPAGKPGRRPRRGTPREPHLPAVPGSIRRAVRVLCASLSILAAAAVGASEWPNWRGPDRNGYSAHTGLPVEWSHDGESERNIVWKLPLPDRSGATPIVVGKRIFLNVAEEDDLSLWLVDADSGEVVWRRPISGGNRFQRKHNMSSPSPVTDGERVWVLTGTGALQAYDMGGNRLWARELEQDYGAFGLNHGYGSSALLWEGVLYVPVLHGMKTDDPSYCWRSTPIRARRSGGRSAPRTPGWSRRTPTSRRPWWRAATATCWS